MNLAVNLSRPPWFKSEILGVILILLAFVVVNLLVATRTPTVYCDEPGYTDPAANLYFGSGFTSTMWGQDRNAFWAGNTPLYQGILFCGFKLFGFGLFQVRAMNTLLAGAAAWLIWCGLRRTLFIQQPAHRLISLALILSGSVSTLTFRTGRYDTTMFFVCAAVFYCCCLPAQWRSRLILVGFYSALLPIAGIPTLPFVGMVGLLNLAVYGLANFSLLLSMAGGMLAGVAALYVFYSHFSSWKTFVEIVLPFTGIGNPVHSQTSTLAVKIFGQTTGDDSLFTCFFGNPAEFLSQKTLFDYSAALLFLLLVIITCKVWRSANLESRRFIIFITAVVLLVPPFMHFVGHYRSYYRWMTYIPLTFAVPRLLEISWLAGKNGLRRWCFGVMAVSIFMGVPLRTLAILPHWSERSIRPLEQTVAQMVQPSDVVVCDYKAYFAVRPRARLVYVYDLPARGAFSQVCNLPTNQITLLCLSPKDFQVVLKIAGGNWKKVPLGEPSVAEALAKTRYAVDFYRRQPQ